MKFKHFSIEEREKVQELLWQKTSIRTIAKVLDRSPSSVSREMNRTIPLKRSYVRGTSIDDRPSEVASRKTVGHWEGDSIISKKSKVGLNTLVERKTGLVLITKIKDDTARVTKGAVIERLSVLPKQTRKTLTSDNGSENFLYDEVQKNLNMLWCFAHPYHSWERGTNENTNGLIRWYFPKKYRLWEN